MGCASLNTKQVQPLLGQEKQIDNSVRIPQGFIHSLKTHNQNIVNSAKIAMDQKTNLMNSFQYFQLNSPLLWQIAINPEYSTANIDLILDLIEGLLNVLPTYIKSNMTYTLYICQTLAAYAKIVFQFYATDEKKRYLKQNIQTKYLNLITDIEQELQIERENHQLINNLEFELFQIKAAFTLTPTNSKEGEEILTQFLGGALKAAITFTLNDDLIEGLKKGIIYIYNEYQKHQMKRKFEIIYYITGLKYEIIQEIYKNSEINSIVEILNKFYLKIIKDCVDWEIKCCWIKSISEIINHKLSLNPQDFHEEHLQICLKKQHILKIQSDCYVNVNNSKISNDTDANLIFQQVEQLKLLSKIQKVLIQGNQELQGLEDFYKIKAKLQSTDSNLLIDKSTLNNIKLHIKNQSIQQKRITEQIKNRGNNNYLDALINEQLDQILLLDQELHQLILFKAQLSTMMYQEDVDNAENQIYMIYYLIDVLRMNNSNVGDEILQNQLCDIGISNEYQQSYKGNINIILKLEQQLKSITFGIMTTEKIRVKLFNIFSVIALYEKVLNHNIEFLLKLQIQLDQVEDIEYCDYRGLEAIINQLYQIMQKIQSDRTFNTEGIKYPSKIQIQLINQWISLRHTDVKLAKLSQFKSNGKVAQLILKIQKSSGEIMKKLIAGVERVQKNIEDSQMIKDSDDSSNLNQIFELLDEQTLNKYNQQKVEQIKLQAIKFKQYFQSIKVDQKQDSHQKQIFEELQGINNSLTVISDFIIITSNNEKCFLLLLSDLKQLLQTFDEQIKQLNNQSVQFDYETEKDFFKKIVEIAKRLTASQQENPLIINNIQKFSDSINQQHLNIRNLQKHGNKYSIQIEEIENEIKVQIEKESEKQYNLKSQIEDLQHLEQLIKSHQFSEYPKELESQIIFILKSIQNHNAPTKLKLFDQFAVQIEDALNNSQWRIRQCIIFDLQKMQSNLLEPQVMAVNQTLLLKFEIYETDDRVKVLFQSPEHIKQYTLLMEQYWPTIEEQVQKTIKKKLDQLNSIVQQIQREKQAQAKQRLQKEYKELQQVINEELQNVSKVESILGITVSFLQDMKQDLILIQDILHQIQLDIKEIGQDIKALRGKSFWDLLELRMKNVFLQMHTALAETIYIPIKTREKLIGNDKQDEQDEEDIEDIEDKLDKEKNVTNLFTDDFFGDGEINEFIWKQNRDTMLIHGLAGSGKSTSSRKIEEFIWRVYEKSQNETDIIPIVPLLIQLPTLKEPDVYAVEETLKSDAYRFNNKQMNEMKESVNQGRLRLVLIFDSFDELKNPFIQKNLYQTNKLEKWRKQGDTYYPKVITTSRTELFTSKDEGYRKLFISTKEDNYKEIRLIKFNKIQIQQYIEEFVSLSKKLTVKEFSGFQDPIDFEKQWTREISSEQDLNLRLENFVQKEKLSQTQQSLKLLWSVEKYKSTMEQQDIKNFLETPFMIEIVMQVLPKFDEQLMKGQEDQKLEQEMFTIYNFYLFFLDSYIDKQIYKVQQTESFINNKYELIDFAQRLAIEMTIHNQSQVEYTSNGLVFKKEISDWRDQFFDDDASTGKYKKLFRQCLPIRQKLGNFSFNHKSLQEFLVGWWFIDNIDKIEDEKYYSEVNWNDINVEWFKEIVKFLKSNRQQQNRIQDSLRKIIQQTKIKEQLIIAGSNSIYILKQLDFDFSRIKWSGMKIQNANLKGINFKHCILENCIFDNVNLDNVNLEYAKLINCKWQNLQFDQIDMFQCINFSIDKIHISPMFQNNQILQLFNRLYGIHIVNPNYRETIQDKCKGVIDYIQTNSINFRLCECGILIENKVYSNQFLQGNQSTQFLKVNQRQNIFNSQQCSCNITTFIFILNGKSWLALSISQDSLQNYDYLLKYDPKKLQTLHGHIDGCTIYNLKTKILIQQTTELIACYENCILATHPGSLISLYDMKSDQIIFQNKQINQGNIVSIAVTYNIQYIIGGSDCSLKLYQKDQESNIFFGHIGVVTQLQFLENKYFLSASQEDHSIRFWNLEHQQSLRLFVTSIKISSFAVDLQRKLLFIGSVQGILQRKDFDFQDLIKCQYKYHKAGILCCDFYDNFKLLATGSKDNVIKVWDLNTERQKGRDMIHGTPLCLQFYGKEILYSGEQQGFIVKWSLDSYTLIRIYDNYGDSVTHLVIKYGEIFSRSTDSVLKVFRSDCLLFYQKENSKQNNQFDIKKHLENYQKAKDLPKFQEILDNSQTTQITSIVHSIKSKYCAYGMANGNLIIQHKYGKRLEQQVFEESKIIKLIELQEAQLICISEQGFKKLKINEESIESLISCNLKNGCNQAILQKDLIKNIQIQETLIIVDDQEITLRNLETVMNDNEIRKIKLNSNTQIITLTVQQRSNEILYCGTQQGRIQIWNIKKEILIDEISISKLPITQLIYLEQANQLIASSEDGNVYFIQNNQIQEKQLQSKKPIRYMEVSEDERFVILAHSSDLTLWHIFENNTEMIDCFGDFKNISALSVNFAHLYVLVGDVNTLYKIPLSLRRISKSLSEELNHYSTCFCVANSGNYIFSGDNLGRILVFEDNSILLKTYVLFENQRINEIQAHDSEYIIIIYENRIVIADFMYGQCLYELLIQSEFVSYCNFPYIYYGMDQSLNSFEFNWQNQKESKSLQLTKNFDIFDRIIAIEGKSYLIIYSEKRNEIQKFNLENKQFSLWENINDQEFKVLGLKMKDSVIQDKFGNDMTKLFQSCGAINLSEQKSIEQPNHF